MKYEEYFYKIDIFQIKVIQFILKIIKNWRISKTKLIFSIVIVSIVPWGKQSFGFKRARVWQQIKVFSIAFSRINQATILVWKEKNPEKELLYRFPQTNQTQVSV